MKVRTYHAKVDQKGMKIVERVRGIDFTINPLVIIGMDDYEFGIKGYYYLDLI